MHEFYAAQKQERAELEVVFVSVAGDLIKKLVRLKKLSEARGHSMQAFRRRANHDQAGELVRQFLAEPGPERAEAGTTP
jgi:hypothetical protein